VSSYQRLLENIAKLSVDEKSIKDHDLRAVARSIEVNQTEARRVRCRALLSDKSHWFVERSNDMFLDVNTDKTIDRLKIALAAGGRHLVEDLAQADVSLQTLPQALLTGAGPELQCSYGLRLSRSAAPDAWVLALNQYSRGVIVQSKQIKKGLIDSGVYVPISVCQASMEDWLSLAPVLFSCDQAKSYRFIADFSDAFDVKSAGLDVLLASYGAAFHATDDVTLRLIVTDVLLTEVQECLSNWQRVEEDLPHVVVQHVMNEALSKSIYLEAHCLVMPYRYEDVGTPVARAAALGLPVLTTAWGGQVEVACATYTQFVDYEFSRATNAGEQFGLYWAEPDQDQLSNLMREQFSANKHHNSDRPVKVVTRSWAKGTCLTTAGPAQASLIAVLGAVRLALSKRAAPILTPEPFSRDSA
jgi:glycosyltransferase involved in cell wall biosynthesis